MSNDLHTADLIWRVIFIHVYLYLFNRCEGMEKVSESVFVGMCQIVGTSQQIAIGRASYDISEIVTRRVATNNEQIKVLMEAIGKGSEWQDLIWTFCSGITTTE